VRLNRRSTHPGYGDGEGKVLAIISSPTAGSRDAALDTHAPLRIVRTGMALLSAQSVTWVASVASVLVVPRLLGADGYGLFASATTITGLGALFAALGSGRIIVRDIAREPAEAASIAYHAVVARLALWLVLAAVAAPVALFFIDRPMARLLLVLLGVAALLSSLGEVALGALQAHHTLGRAALVRSAVGIGAQLATISLVAAGAGVVGMSAVAVAASFVVAAATGRIFWSRYGGPVRWQARRCVELWRAGLPLLAVELGVMVYTSAGTLVLAASFGAVAVGPYALAWRLISIPTFVLSVVANATFPALAAAHHDPARFRILLANALRVLIAATVPMAVGLVVLAPQVVHLIGGDEFRDAAPVVRIFACALPLLTMNTVLALGVLAIDRQHSWALVMGAFGAANAALTLAAVHLSHAAWGSGAIGAALVPCTLELAMNAVAMWLLGRHCDRGATFGTMARALIASAPMALVVWLVAGQAGAIAAVPVGAAVYAAGAAWLRLLSRADLATIRAALRRGGPTPAELPAAP
jgi:PST family polysaccharide transporter